MNKEEFEHLPDLLKVKEVAKLLRIKPGTVRKMIRCGRILEHEIFQPTPNAHKLIYKKAIYRLLKIDEKPKSFPTQTVYTISKKTAENLRLYHDEDVRLGIAGNYAPYRVCRATNDDSWSNRQGLGICFTSNDKEYCNGKESKLQQQKNREEVDADRRSNRKRLAET
ncbi:MAG: hypothetical protein IJG38_01945 [Thermoguttaceae bacterium]|nr:hypothetical protein [Thermoguttaceae bacterium]